MTIHCTLQKYFTYIRFYAYYDLTNDFLERIDNFEFRAPFIGAYNKYLNASSL